jgi:signal transduction histidine kinase/ligand-binding sensor domain-containing protein
MLNPATALLAALLLSGAAASGNVPSANDLPFSDDYVLRTWEVTEGLRDNHISSIAQTADGYLWITNFSGLFRFDGERFVRMDKESMPGLPTPWVTPAFAARDGVLWLGLERGGVACWRGNAVETLLPIQPRPTSAVWPWSFAEENPGAVWIGTANATAASRIFEGKVTAYTAVNGIPKGTPTVIRLTTDGKVWAATSSGCAIFDGRRFQPVDPGAGGARRPALAPSHAGGMWTIRGGKLLRYDSSGQRLETYTPEWLPGIGQINALLEDRTGILWIATRDFGLLRFHAGEFQRVHASFTDISCLAEDHEGNLWVGSWGGGLNRLSPRHFYLEPIGLSSNTVRSLGEDAEGRLWVLNREGLPKCAWEPGGHTFAAVPGWPEGLTANVLCPDPKGGIWLGTSRGLMHWQDGVVRETSFRDSVAVLLPAPGDELWIATTAGKIFRGRDGHFEANGDVPEACVLAQDQRGCLWIGTRKGTVFRQENGRSTPVTLPGAGADENVRFIVPDGSAVWIGTLLGGLYRWEDGQVRHVSGSAVASLAEMRSLLIERARSSQQDVFWIGTATGLLRVSRGDLEGFLNGKYATLRMTACGSNEGLPNAEFIDSPRNAIQTRDGRLRFATNRGVLEIQPGSAPESPTSAGVRIEEASAGPITFRPGISKAWIFPPFPGAIRIRYTLPELAMPEQVRFRYRLNNGSSIAPWIEVGNQREATILQPEPGDYRFEVTAAVGDDTWLAPPAAVAFTVLPAWWQAAVFRWGIALAGIGFIALGVWRVVTLRMRARIRRLEQKHAIERERGRIARDMHDEIGANLTHIAAATRLATIEPATGHLDEIAAVARQTVDSLDEIVWAVNPRNDTLAGTVEYIAKHASRFLGVAGIAAEIDLPNALPEQNISAEVRHHLFRVVKEALNNVAKHSGAANARLDIRFGAKSLEILVADDGHGFDPGAAGAFSNGLANMRSRMAGIGGRCRIDSAVGAGSRVTLELPLPGNTPPRHNQPL